ncbi:phosphonopyruvate decarboxylase [Streptomyces goshikiensis]|uniref:phosphonopyruvate decarboxylase n=1 Tax=Streptomyces goshikiensis TaxID=1942 RepID=UPI0036B8DF5F
MSSSKELVAALERQGIGLVAGVPCSYFAGPLRELAGWPGISYVPAVNEGTALATAAGARLSGTPAAVIAQNSGFGNLVNPLTSLVLPYRIPLLVMISMRGWPTASSGEPQHAWMGKVVPRWLDSMRVPHWMLRAGGPSFEETLHEARPVLASGLPAFILVAKGAIRDDPVAAVGSDRQPAGHASLPDRDDLVDAALAEIRDEFVLSTTGYLSRALFNRGDRPRNFYMQGSMGHIGSIALGAALTRPDECFLVLDGDGSVLMHMGALTTIGHFAPPNLVHVVFDNQVYDSTGGQATTAVSTAFDAVARGSGYRRVWSVASTAELRPAMRAALDAEGPALLWVRGRPGGEAGERASGNITVRDIARRFTAELTGDGPLDRGEGAV